METENKKNAGELTQITFKLTADDRQTIQETADSLELNVSEYCRIKCLVDENVVIVQQNQIMQLEKEVKQLKVKLAYYKNSERNPNHIVLELSKVQKNIIDDLFNDFTNKNERLSSNIIDALIHITTEDIHRKNLFYSKKITVEEIEKAFYPTEEDE